ncbi:hypothetical protein [Heliorestis convoluta]|uniref:hypothetical protein n=1 Tax=Heliorestis convoluta TaxID=356322 RepID=UPI00129AF050|nr:hypothetical protein [Heliorestis convoluta]
MTMINVYANICPQSEKDAIILIAVASKMLADKGHSVANGNRPHSLIDVENTTSDELEKIVETYEYLLEIIPFLVATVDDAKMMLELRIKGEKHEPDDMPF